MIYPNMECFLNGMLNSQRVQFSSGAKALRRIGCVDTRRSSHRLFDLGNCRRKGSIAMGGSIVMGVPLKLCMVY